MRDGSHSDIPTDEGDQPPGVLRSSDHVVARTEAAMPQPILYMCEFTCRT